MLEKEDCKVECSGKTTSTNGTKPGVGFGLENRSSTVNVVPGNTRAGVVKSTENCGAIRGNIWVRDGWVKVSN